MSSEAHLTAGVEQGAGSTQWAPTRHRPPCTGRREAGEPGLWSWGQGPGRADDSLPSSSPYTLWAHLSQGNLIMELLKRTHHTFKRFYFFAEKSHYVLTTGPHLLNSPGTIQ